MHFFLNLFQTPHELILISKPKDKTNTIKIEAIFKAFAKAIKMAVKRDPDKRILPSTKGVL